MPNETLTATMVDAKAADPDVALDVDEMILHYLVYTTIKSITSRDRAQTGGFVVEGQADNLVNIFDTYLQLFKAKHPGHYPSEDIQFGIRLLEFLVLFTRRGRSSRPSDRADQTSVEMRKRRAPDVRMSGMEEDDANGDTQPDEDLQPSSSFLETLPLFLSISAVITSTTNWTPSKVWMELAAEYMLQAAIEQYTHYGATGPDALETCFQWGWRPEIDRAPNGNNEDLMLINDMFTGDGAEEVPGWSAIKQRYLRVFGSFKQSHFANPPEHLRRKFQRTRFEGKIFEYIQGLLDQFLPKPILLQLEMGKLDALGLSEAETEAFQQRVGISTGG